MAISPVRLLGITGLDDAYYHEEAREGEVVISISPDDLKLLVNGLGESLEAVDEFEYQTRTGFSKDHAFELHRAVRSVVLEIDAMNRRHRGVK